MVNVNHINGTVQANKLYFMNFLRSRPRWSIDMLRTILKKIARYTCMRLVYIIIVVGAFA